MIIKSHLRMIMKKHIVHNFSFYIDKKINIQKNHKMKKKLNIKLIFSYQQKGKSYLFYKRTNEN